MIIANVIAWPIAGWLMHRWMQNFAFRAPFMWWLYPLAGGATLLVALLTAAGYTARACGVNPVETLRQE